ncbi:hypothetical protein [Maribacter sp. 2308TA10-17]|uniref:hypothetical protein n=1 Tax=Maribacter sp. 2308TA10-17 TaxID=3386276 RepID=UPI0039BD7FEE
MSYKTNKYIKNSFGIVPEFAPGKKLTYEVKDKNIYIVGYSGVPKVIPLTDNTSVEPDTENGLGSIIKGRMGFGNVIIKNSSGEHRIEGLKNINSFIEAIFNEINGALDEIPKKNQNTEDSNYFNENDLSDVIVYYPHIAKTVNEIFVYRLKRNIFKKKPVYRNLMKNGDIVRKGDVIAEYGTIEITSASDGKIVFLSNEQPGKYEWPQNADSILEFPKDLDNEDCYCVGIRILNNNPESSEFRIKNFYNNGNWFAGNDKKIAETVFSIIDEAYSNTIEIPKHLRKNPILEKYWRLIEDGKGYIEKINS